MTPHAVVSTAREGRPNQDRAATDGSHGVFVVADGIGGLADAAATADAVVTSVLGAVRCAPGRVGQVELATVLAGVSERVRRGARLGPGTAGAAVAVIVLRHGVAVIGHLGDCRAVLVRAGASRRLTVDHVHQGTLTRFAGMPGPVEVATTTVVLHPGDRMLLHTDGLSVLDGRILDGVLDVPSGQEADLDDVCRRLERCARDGGARDDVTVVLLAPERRPATTPDRSRAS